MAGSHCVGPGSLPWIPWKSSQCSNYWTIPPAPTNIGMGTYVKEAGIQSQQHRAAMLTTPRLLGRICDIPETQDSMAEAGQESHMAFLQAVLFQTSPDNSGTAGPLPGSPVWTYTSLTHLLFVFLYSVLVFACLLFETVSQWSVETGLELTMCPSLVLNLWWSNLCHPTECWGYRHVAPRSTQVL